MRGKWLTRANVLGCLGLLALAGLIGFAIYSVIVLRLTFV